MIGSEEVVYVRTASRDDKDRLVQRSKVQRWVATIDDDVGVESRAYEALMRVYSKTGGRHRCGRFDRLSRTEPRIRQMLNFINIAADWLCKLPIISISKPGAHGKTATPSDFLALALDAPVMPPGADALRF
jgi:hypothetical protein